MRRRALLFWPALPVVVVVFFHRIALSNRILARGDVYLYFYPYWEAAAAALRDGHLPLWNSDLFMGAPLLANSQVGFFYPLNWPLWLLLEVSYAATATILIHLTLAASGAYLLARRALGLVPEAASLSALLFGLGGYLTAQVEHLNQLQGLAWLPWAVLVAGAPAGWAGRRNFVRRAALLALVLGLQLTAGHSQTVFITGIALVLWWLGGLLAQRATWRAALPQLLGLALAVVLAAALSAVQLVPTLELAGQSSRQGGLALKEALSFSLHPLLLGRALLPGYGETLFTEYVAFLPLTALILSVLGAWLWRQTAKLWPAGLLAITGLFFALGQFNPLYAGLAMLPGFSLFRAPARWLALYALGAALLSGAGWQRWRAGEVRLQRPVGWAVAGIAALVVWSLLAPLLAQFVPTPSESPVANPAWLTLGGWMLELLLALFLLSRRGDARGWAAIATGVLMAFALYAGGRALPYHRLATAPQAYFSLRPPVARLQAVAPCESEAACGEPAGRVLSLSNIFFDLGDGAELESAYGDYLAEPAFAQLLVAYKQKEVLDPNLPLRYGIPSVDGFDGGILPLRAYVELTSLLLPGGEVTTDGRLREFLAEVPAARWLDLLQAKYLITDKTGDVWREGVFFDTQHHLALASGEEQEVGYLPSYEATAVWLLAEGPGEVEMVANGDVWTLQTEPLGEGLWEVVPPRPAVSEKLVLRAGSEPWEVEALALVDSRDDSFQPLVPGAYRLIHSGDVKIYENLDVPPRAFVVARWQWREGVAESVTAMADPSFEPRSEAVLVGSGEPGTGPDAPGTARITSYEPQQVVVVVKSAQPGLLVLSDAAYPGWTATVGGEPAPIYQADGLFRGVMVPAGEHEVVFRYAPQSLRWGAALSALGLALWLALLTAGMAGRIERKGTPKS